MRPVTENGFAVLMALLALGCQSPIAEKSDPPDPIVDFRPAETGTIRGRVVWSGEVPTIEPIKLLVAKPGESREQPNPNAPRVDAKSKGVGGVLAYLKDVDPARSRPWPHDPVEVVFDAGRLDVLQGGRPARIGVVKTGETIACQAREEKNHILVLRGARTASLPLFKSAVTTHHKLDKPGTIELSSGAALYWLRGHLLVSNHPYAAVTAADGTFEMVQAPAGTYDIVLWSPNWHIVRRERNPELSDVERLVFADAAQKSKRITVTAGETAECPLELTGDDFPKK